MQCIVVNQFTAIASGSDCLLHKGIWWFKYSNVEKMIKRWLAVNTKPLIYMDDNTVQMVKVHNLTLSADWSGDNVDMVLWYDSDRKLDDVKYRMQLIETPRAAQYGSRHDHLLLPTIYTVGDNYVFHRIISC